MDKKLDKKTANDEVFEYAYVFYKRDNVDYQGYKYICPGDNKLIDAIAKYDENANLGSGEPVKNSDCATKGYVDKTKEDLSTDYTSLIDRLSDTIDKKIYIEDKISSEISGYSDLSVIKLSSSEYQDLVYSDAISPSTLYVV